MSAPRELTTSKPKNHKITLVDSFNFSGNKNSFKIVCANPDQNTVLYNDKRQNNLEHTNSDTKENIVKLDVKKGVNCAQPVKPYSHDIGLSWRKLQKFFMDAVRTKHPSIKSQNARHKQAANYINCWIIAGHSYSNLKQMIRRSDSRVQQGQESHDAFKRRQWVLLNKRRKLLEETVSLSFLIDKSVEFLRLEIKAENNVTTEEKPDLYADIQRRLDTMGNYIEMGFRINTKGTPEETEAAVQTLNKMVKLYENHNGKLT